MIQDQKSRFVRTMLRSKFQEKGLSQAICVHGPKMMVNTENNGYSTNKILFTTRYNI